MGFMSMAGTAVEENGDCVRVGLLLLFLLFQLLRGPERDLKSEQPQTRDGGVKMARTDASGVLDRNRPRQVELGVIHHENTCGRELAGKRQGSPLPWRSQSQPTGSLILNAAAALDHLFARVFARVSWSSDVFFFFLSCEKETRGMCEVGECLDVDTFRQADATVHGCGPLPVLPRATSKLLNVFLSLPIVRVVAKW